MKNIFKINILVYIFFIISFLTGSFKEVFIISFLIIIHEIGHVLLAKIEKIKVKKIVFYPLGGISKIDIPLNINPFKEFIILIAGPIFQCIACLILIILFPKYQEEIILYHKNILLFNILPIYPLDGGKLLRLIIELFLPFQKSFYFIIIISYITTITIFIMTPQKKINMFLTTFFLLFLIQKEYKKRKIRYEKFLLERYLNEYNFSKSCIIKNKNNFYRNRKHLIKEGDNYYLEKEYLLKKYHKISKNY